MKVERIHFKSCCGGTSTIFKVNKSISNDLLQLLKNNGYIESPTFTKSGILYMDSTDLTITGAFNSNKLQLKCKNNNCEQVLNQLETLLTEHG